MARIADTSVEAVKAAADVVEVISGRTQLQAIGRALHRALPVPRRADAVVLRQSRRRHVLLLRLPARRRRDLVRRGDRGRRLRRSDRVARRSASTFRSSTRRLRPSRTRSAGSGIASTPCSTRRPPSTSATSGSRRRGRQRRAYLETGDSPRRSAASTGSASPPAARTLARKARRAGLHAAGADRGRARQPRAATTTSQGRLLFPIADARGRVVGFQARQLCEDDPLQAKYVNSPEGELFRKGDLLYGLRPRAHRDRARENGR